MQDLPGSSAEGGGCFHAFFLAGVVVFVAVLFVAVTMPRYTEVSTRAKIGRAKAEMRVLATALECYYVDNGRYPDPDIHAAQSGLAGDHLVDVTGNPILPRLGPAWNSLTSPISYVSSLPYDPFDNAGKPSNNIINAFDPENDAYFCVGRYDYSSDVFHQWILASNGPRGEPVPGRSLGKDMVLVRDAWGRANRSRSDIWTSEVVEAKYIQQASGMIWFFEPYPGGGYVYNPTNGEYSHGLIVRTGP